MNKYELMDVVDKLPIDLLVKPISQLIRDTVLIKVTMRNEVFKNKHMDYITASNFHIINTNAKNVGIVCVTEFRNGIYQITIKKNINKIPVNLDLGEYIEFNILVDLIDFTGYASGLVRIEKKCAQWYQRLIGFFLRCYKKKFIDPKPIKCKITKT